MRAFIAVELPEEVRQRLHDLIDALAGVMKGVRWVAPERLHLTLRFLGDVASETIPSLTAAVAGPLAGTSGFSASLHGVGSFPSRGRARIVWVGVERGADRLQRLSQALDEGLARWGMPPENRAFRPHVTLGRARRGPVATEPLARAHIEETPFPVEALTLFESQLSRRGPRYLPLARIACDGSVP